MTEELTNIQTQLAAQQQQIADAQQRLTALEAGRGPAAGGDLLGLLTTAAGIASRFARTAAEAHATQEKPAEEAPRRERRAGGLAAKLAELREDAAKTTERAPLFPIDEPAPAAPYAGRTAPRRTLPPEAPVRLWNRDYTDKLDVIGRAASGGLDGVQRIRIRDDHADSVRQWLRDRITDDEHVFAVWADRPWSFVGYGSGGGSGPLSLDLLPMPKPPRVDEALGRAPYAGPFPDLAAGDRIGVEHPETGKITIHEFSGDPANPNLCGALNPHRQPDKPLRCERAQGHQGSHNAVDVAASGGRIIVWAAGPVGTVTSGLIHTTPERCGFTLDDSGCLLESGHPNAHQIDGEPNCGCGAPHTEPDVDEVLPMPGGPNDRLAQATRPPFCNAVDPKPLRNGGNYACTRPPAHTGDHAAHISPVGPPVSVWPNDAPKPSGYGDLYARLDAIHDATDDAVDQGDDQ